MVLVVGASESTMKSLLGKLGGLLAQEYTLIRGVAGDLQYINDELATWDSRRHSHDHQSIVGFGGVGKTSITTAFYRVVPEIWRAVTGGLDNVRRGTSRNGTPKLWFISHDAFNKTTSISSPLVVIYVQNRL